MVFSLVSLKALIRNTKHPTQNTLTNLREFQLPRFLKYWLPLIAYCLLIFIQSSFPSPVKEPDIPFFDKYLHILGYALLGALFCRAYGSLRFGGKFWRIAFLSVLSAGLYGISDEIHQHFVPGRSADVMDVAADFVGAAWGVLFYKCFVIIRTVRSPR
ncbi:MAG: VanZ family protein [Desulfobacterales bacterium]